MNVFIKRIDNNLPLPQAESKGAVAFDFVCRKNISIHAHEVAFLPLNVIIQVPKEYVLFITARSSLPNKKGLLVPHGIGIIDQDYCGKGDEIKLEVLNFTDKIAEIARGERIAQGIFLRYSQVVWEERESVHANSRGGWGSTGGYK